MAKAPTRKTTAKKAPGPSRALATARAKVAKLEQSEKKKRAIAEASAGVKTAQAKLAAAKKLKG